MGQNHTTLMLKFTITLTKKILPSFIPAIFERSKCLQPLLLQACWQLRDYLPNCKFASFRIAYQGKVMEEMEGEEERERERERERRERGEREKRERVISIGEKGDK
jgi:hypothetical protein